MYDDIVDFYDEIFPLNQGFIRFLGGFLVQDKARVLDLGCGPGDYVGRLAAEGHQAIGIDSSEGMITAAKENHPGEFYPYAFSMIDQLEGKFEIIYCVGNSLSYLPNDQLGEFMEDVTRLLVDRGTFLVQVVNWDRFLGRGRIDFDVKMLSEGRSFHRRYEPRDDGTVVFHTAVRKDDEVLGAWADVLFPKTAQMLAGAVEAAGLIVSGVYGDYSEAAFDPDSSPALILTARK